jgi:nucleotide-binding universal stress UspA family protein
MAKTKTTAKVTVKKKVKATLLVADDLATDAEGSRRTRAVRDCAAELARALGTAVDLFHVDDRGPYEKQHKKAYDERREQLIREAQALSASTGALYVQGDPVAKILSLTKKKAPYQLAILGTQGRKGLKRLILGSVAEEVIRNSRIPILTIGPGYSGRFSASGMTILVATELTRNSLPAQDFALHLARKTGARVVLIHSMYASLHPVLQTAFMVPTAPPDVKKMFEEAKADALKRLAKLAQAFSKKGIAVETVLDDKTQSSSEAVLQQAKRSSASLMILGTHGRSMVSSAFFGKTARDVVLEAETPVITVHSKFA